MSFMKRKYKKILSELIEEIKEESYLPMKQIVNE